MIDPDSVKMQKGNMNWKHKHKDPRQQAHAYINFPLHMEKVVSVHFKMDSSVVLWKQTNQLQDFMMADMWF